MLSESDYPLTNKVICMKIGRTQKEVNQVLYPWIRRGIVERFTIENSWPMFTLVTRKANSSREHSLSVLRAKSEATKLNDVKLQPKVLSVLTVDNPLTIPEISENLKLPRPDVCRVLHTAMREDKVKKIFPTEAGEKPLWLLKTSTLSTPLIHGQQAQFEGKPLFTLEAVTNDHITFRKIKHQDITQAAAYCTKPTTSSSEDSAVLTTAETNLSSASFTSQNKSTSTLPTKVETLKFNLSTHEKKEVKDLLQSIPRRTYSSKEVMERIGAETRDIVMVCLDELTEKGLVKRKQQDPTNIKIYEWISD